VTCGIGPELWLTTAGRERSWWLLVLAACGAVPAMVLAGFTASPWWSQGVAAALGVVSGLLVAELRARRLQEDTEAGERRAQGAHREDFGASGRLRRRRCPGASPSGAAAWWRTAPRLTPRSGVVSRQHQEGPRSGPSWFRCRGLPGVAEDVEAEVAVTGEDERTLARGRAGVAVSHGLVPDREHAPEVVAAHVDEAPDFGDPLAVESDYPESGVVVRDVAEVLPAGVGLDLVDGQDPEPAGEGRVKRLRNRVGADDREIRLGRVVQVQVADLSSGVERGPWTSADGLCPRRSPLRRCERVDCGTVQPRQS